MPQPRGGPGQQSKGRGPPPWPSKGGKMGGRQPRGQGQPLFGLPPTSQQVSVPCTILILQTVCLTAALCRGQRHDWGRKRPVIFCPRPAETRAPTNGARCRPRASGQAVNQAMLGSMSHGPPHKGGADQRGPTVPVSGPPPTGANARRTQRGPGPLDHCAAAHCAAKGRQRALAVGSPRDTLW